MTEIESLGSMLRAELQKLGWSQEEFRDALRDRQGVVVVKSTISSWLCNDRRPDLTNLVAICDTLGIHGKRRLHALSLAAQPTPNRAARENADEAA